MKPLDYIVAALLLLLAFGQWDGCAVVGSPPPFKTDRIRVLVVEESGEHGKYTNDQLNVIQSTDRASVKAAVEARKGEFQIIDLDTADNLANAASWVREAMGVKRDALPWVVAAGPASGFSVPLPSEADLLKRVEGLR